MFSPDLLPLLRCPEDHASLAWNDNAAVCSQCGECYPLRDGFLEILPRQNFDHTTQYNRSEGGEILDYREMGPPLLSAGVKNSLLNDYLRFTPGDTILDLGCGNGKFAWWNRNKVKRIWALDLAPWFSDAARADLPLLRGDIRALPYDDASLDKIYSIDVLEHLTLNDLERVLGEAHRTLKPGGRLFLFSNTRERPALGWLMGPQRAVTDWLQRRRAVDFRRDEWRKADHVKAIATYEELQQVLAANGFRIERVRFWNGVLQGWIENVFLKLGESWTSKRAPGREELERQAAARQEARRALNSRKGTGLYMPLAALTALMSLDLKLFGRLRAGPYFVLAVKT